MRIWFAAAVALSMLFAIPARALAGDTLYAALILANNAERPKEMPPEIRGQAENLRAVFGYNQFEVLGEKRRTVVDGQEDWLMLSPRFFLRVDVQSPIPGGYALGVRLFREKKEFAQARAKVRRQSPLFIRGPMTPRGQVIVLLTIL